MKVNSLKLSLKLIKNIKFMHLVKTMDISNLKSIEKYIKNKNIDYFIHAAAFSTPMSDHKKS